MTRQRREKSKTEKELIHMLLVRQISTIQTSFEEGEKSIEEIRKYYWSKLLGWEGAKNCLATMQAIISCALNSRSSFYQEAHSWIEQNIKDSGFASFTRAICILTASYSQNRRSQILNEIIDKYELYFEGTASQFWQSTRIKQALSWKEIKTVIASDFPWNPWPILREQNGSLSEKSEELFWACYWVTENPNEQDFKGIIIELLEQPHLENTPRLRKQILTHSLWKEDDIFLQTISREYFLLFAEEITEILINPEPPDSYYNYKDEEKTQAFEKLFPLAELFVNKVKYLEESRRNKLTARLLEANDHPWIFSIADELFKFCQDSSQQSQFLFKHTFPSGGHRWSGFRCGAKLRNEFYQNSHKYKEIFAKAIHLLFCENKALLFKLFILKNDYHFPACDLLDLVGQDMKKNPDVYQQVLSETVKSGKCDIKVLLNYLDAIGIEKGKDDLKKWLSNYPEHSIRDRERKDFNRLVSEYIVPNEISAGRLFSRYIHEFLDLGYELCQDDVSDGKKLFQILPSTQEYGRIKLLSDWKLWGNQCARKTLLHCGHNEQITIRSILIEADSRHHVLGKPLDWLEQVLIPECENNDRLKNALCSVAWDEKLYYSETTLARQLLMKADRLEKWMTKEHKKSMQEWLKKHWDYLFRNDKETANKLLTIKEQRKLFFENALKDKNSTNCIYTQPENLAHFFQDDKTKKQLANWLIKNVHLIMSRTWIDWVKYYNLDQFPIITKQIGRMINENYRNFDFVESALEILKGKEKIKT